MTVETTLVAHTQRVLVIAPCMGAHQLFVACLVDLSVTGDVVVIARKSETVLVTADEGGDGEVLVAPCG